jgi:hypothetical protein
MSLKKRVEHGNRFTEQYRKDLGNLLDGLKDKNGHIDQEKLLKGFGSFSESIHKKVESARKAAEKDGGITFSPAFIKEGVYGLVNGTDEAISVQTKNKENAVIEAKVSPRLLLWTGDSPVHTHIVPKDLTNGEVLCAFDLVAGKTTEAQFKISDKHNNPSDPSDDIKYDALVSGARTLQRGLTVDRYKGDSAQVNPSDSSQRNNLYTHQFFPQKENLGDIYFLEANPKDLSSTVETPVRIITANIYNTEKTKGAAYGDHVKDENPEVTKQAVEAAESFKNKVSKAIDSLHAKDKNKDFGIASFSAKVSVEGQEGGNKAIISRNGIESILKKSSIKSAANRLAEVRADARNKFGI